MCCVDCVLCAVCCALCDVCCVLCAVCCVLCRLCAVCCVRAVCGVPCAVCHVDTHPLFQRPTQPAAHTPSLSAKSVEGTRPGYGRAACPTPACVAREVRHPCSRIAVRDSTLRAVRGMEQAKPYYTRKRPLRCSDVDRPTPIRGRLLLSWRPASPSGHAGVHASLLFLCEERRPHW